MDIETIKKQIETELKEINSGEALEGLRLKYLGRKGLIAELTGSIPDLNPEERASFGRQVNELKNRLVAFIDEKQNSLSLNTQSKKADALDISLPGIAQELGSLHPLTQTIEEICALFTRMGFCVVEGPEIESEYNNFTGLNISLVHPSRDAFDTFYLKDYPKLLLRSHTSPVQVRVMKQRKPPLAIVVPGRVYRPDAVDASHSFMFHQVEGFLVDRKVRFSDLKGTLELLAKGIFGPGIKMRFRPHFFPFTEPSAEVDISCIMCRGRGCSVCAKKGWLEILGSGMIHPSVFKNVGYNPKIYKGFAFGMGVERIAMLKYGINDIRLFFQNDLRFLKQF